MTATALNRFIEAQEVDYHNAFAEIKTGRKRSHWMWYIFPQIEGLGYSSMAKRYVLGRRLVEISKALLEQKSNNATEIMGTPDDLKLWSSMTLFSLVPGADPVFEAVLKKYFGGVKDKATLQLI